MLLFSIISVILVTIFILLVEDFLKLSRVYAQSIALTGALVCFCLSTFFLILFDRSSTEYQFVLFYSASNLLNGFVAFPKDLFYYTHQFFTAFGLDGISLFFVLLSTFITPLCLLTSYKDGLFRVKEYCLVLLTVELFLIFSFTALDLITFFFFFEIILLPMFFLIGI